MGLSMLKHLISNMSLFFLRCLLEEEDDYCREKDSEIEDLNKMVVEFSGLLRHLEMEKAEFNCRDKSQVSCDHNIPFP